MGDIDDRRIRRTGEMTDSRRDEPVRLTRIYTRGGDGGETSLGDGTRTPKTDPLIAAIGSLDELGAAIGLALAAPLPERLRSPLERVQNELFDLGADLSVPPAEGSRERLRIGPERIEALERLCDELNAELEPLRSFALPGGGEAAARVDARQANRLIPSRICHLSRSPNATIINIPHDLPFGSIFTDNER
jgi:ATP:cob(I)alamin adenosyltransferase